MGETREEVSQALRDLHEAGCDLITITQYLRPSPGTTPSSGGSSPRSSWSRTTRPSRSASPASCPAAGALVVPCGPSLQAGARVARACRPAGLTDFSRRATMAATPQTQRAERGSEAMARKDKTAKQGRLSQIAASYKMTKQADLKIGLVLLGTFLLTAGVIFGVLLLVPGFWVFDLIGAVLLGVLALLIVFGRRAQRAGYAQIEGQPGAAAPPSACSQRAGSSTAVGFNRNQDVVHRVVGRRDRPGRRGQPEPAQVAAGHRAPQARAGRLRRDDPRGDRRQRPRRGPADQARPPRHQAGPQPQAGADDRRALLGSARSTRTARTSRSPRARCRPA